MHLNRAITPLEITIYRNYRLVHGIRMAIAFTLTFLLVRLANIPESTWPLITVVVVMGPLSYWGNVTSRALQRILGTLMGATSGLMALFIGHYSLLVMLIWLALTMILCGVLALGKKPYMGLMIGITLCVVCGNRQGTIDTALWRSGDVILGAILALVFTSIYPQRAIIDWRLKMHTVIRHMSDIYNVYASSQVIERPDLTKREQEIISTLIKTRSLVEISARELHIDPKIMASIQTVSRNLASTLELITEAYWSGPDSHLILQNLTRLRDFQRLTVNTLDALSSMLINCDMQNNLTQLPEMRSLSYELKEAMEATHSEHGIEAPIYGYLWLNMQMAIQLDELRHLLSNALKR